MIDKYEGRAYARVTLGLDIISRQDDGYHRLNSIKQKINLFDSIRILDSKEMRIICNTDRYPLSSDNTMWRATELIKRHYDIKKNIEIEIEKKIPMMSGLAGGSTDAGFIIDALDKIWGLEMSLDDKITIGRQVGMDVAYFFFDGICVDQEISGRPVKISDNSDLCLVLVYPGFGISTSQAFFEFDQGEIFRESEKIDQLKEAIITEYSSKSIGPFLYNRFEETLFKKYPVLSSIKQDLIDMGSDGASLSGSGSALFGVVNNSNLAKNIVDKINSLGYRALFIKTI